MLSEALLAAAFQIGPFYEQKPDYAALRPFWAHEGQTTDVVWPLFTSHRDWWRFLFFVHSQSNARGYQFEIMPLWWNGSADDESYWGFFPFYGTHPHIALLYDIRFALWPVWMQYKMPRPGEKRWLTTNAVLFPFIHWRDDGSWGFWPFYVQNHQRASFHQTALWPIVTWATYEADRDTAGEGSSWMVWPLAGRVAREREDQWLFLPPFISFATTYSKSWTRNAAETPERRIHLPWPVITFESNARRERMTFFPIYERVVWRGYGEGERKGSVHRFGWKLVELYDDETRVFPFWVSRKDDAYFRLWPFWESEVGKDGIRRGRVLSLFPIRHVPAVDRNWAKFWTFYEQTEVPGHFNEHSLFWGLIRWRTTPEVVCD